MNSHLVDILDNCADLLAYPNDEFVQLFSQTLSLADDFLNYQNAQNNSILGKNFFKSLQLDELRSDYINFFDLHSSKFKTSLRASFWLDGKIYGESYNKIVKFYANNGYEIYQDADHISNLIAFCAILAQNGDFKNLKEFLKFLSWIPNLRLNLKKWKNLMVFDEILNITECAINSLKEQKC